MYIPTQSTKLAMQCVSLQSMGAIPRANLAFSCWCVWLDSTCCRPLVQQFQHRLIRGFSSAATPGSNSVARGALLKPQIMLKLPNTNNSDQFLTEQDGRSIWHRKPQWKGGTCCLVLTHEGGSPAANEYARRRITGPRVSAVYLQLSSYVALSSCLSVKVLAHVFAVRRLALCDFRIQ